jgi:hypothetical protein
LTTGNVAKAETDGSGSCSGSCSSGSSCGSRSCSCSSGGVVRRKYSGRGSGSSAGARGHPDRERDRNVITSSYLSSAPQPRERVGQGGEIRLVDGVEEFSFCQSSESHTQGIENTLTQEERKTVEIHREESLREAHRLVELTKKGQWKGYGDETEENNKTQEKTQAGSRRHCIDRDVVDKKRLDTDKEERKKKKRLDLIRLQKFKKIKK